MKLPFNPSEAVLYGQCVEAAYKMFEAKNPDPLQPEPIGIPDGWTLSAWIQMSDYVLQDATPKFYGVVLHSVADPNQRIVAIRGTEGAAEWLDDAFAILTPFKQVPDAGRVAAGFDQIYSSIKVHPVPHPTTPGEIRAEAAAPEPFQGSFGDQMEQLAVHRETERGVSIQAAADGTRVARPTVVVGHSLGSALATLFTLENSVKGKFDIQTCCTFASPRVGNTAFINRFNALPLTSWRIVNIRDVVPKVPLKLLPLFDYEHVDGETSFDSYPFAQKNLGCFHAMSTYLHGIDPAISAGACALPPVVPKH